MIVSALGTLFGWEGVKWLLNRKSNKRIGEASADTAEVKAENEEFHHLRELTDWLQQQLKAKEERFQEQTQLVRQLNSKLLDAETKVARLEAEKSMKLCEVRNCANRQPQSGY